ncbi:MAG: bifunctional UDP-N-acetylglucosamine diphosphorylase/glucosamine-1-phosphate N-acetyltransferase GlmU [Ruminococcaceae bacterium]|nr:bifunctional UDP-N-acetylglucosamine diphosphorylase/glucosamine-1-phosphate N-acetyltransferase GlmU [Oscillospiraceae bacterium]
MELCSIILAAGEGKRMKSNTAKPLMTACGKPLIDYVLSAAKFVGTNENIVVIGHKADDIKAHLEDSVTYAYQLEQKGTGHAVMQGIEPISEKDGIVMVLCGDTPLIKGEDLKAVLDSHIEAGRAATVITAIAPNPFGYGRVIRNGENIAKIVEQKDATDAEKAVLEINSGMYFFDIKKLAFALSKLTNNNAQGEYYLTDTIEILISEGEKVGAEIVDFESILGVNDRVQLASAEAVLNRRNVEKVMLSGVTVINPSATYIGADVSVGIDSVIYPGTILEGKTVIGENCIIGPDTKITDTKIGDNTEIIKSVLVKSEVGNKVSVGPFAYMRPNSKVGDNVKIGDFVEIKNATIDNGTKVAHLTYVGDADVGKNVNFGCGTVVVNYDGKNKHRSTIGDDVFIGCNTNLVSPVKVNDGAFTAAGSTITDEVPENALAIARAKQVNKENWVKPKDR